MYCFRGITRFTRLKCVNACRLVFAILLYIIHLSVCSVTPVVTDYAKQNILIIVFNCINWVYNTSWCVYIQSLHLRYTVYVPHRKCYTLLFLYRRTRTCTTVLYNTFCMDQYLLRYVTRKHVVFIYTYLINLLLLPEVNITNYLHVM